MTCTEKLALSDVSNIPVHRDHQPIAEVRYQTASFYTQSWTALYACQEDVYTSYMQPGTSRLTLEHEIDLKQSLCWLHLHEPVSSYITRKLLVIGAQVP